MWSIKQKIQYCIIKNCGSVFVFFTLCIRNSIFKNGTSFEISKNNIAIKKIHVCTLLNVCKHICILITRKQVQKNIYIYINT